MTPGAVVVWKQSINGSTSLGYVLEIRLVCEGKNEHQNN